MQSVAVRLVVERATRNRKICLRGILEDHGLAVPAGNGPVHDGPEERQGICQEKRCRPGPKGFHSVGRRRPGKGRRGWSKGLPAGAFSAELARWQGGEFKAVDEVQADAIYAVLNGASYIVTKVEQKDRQEKRRRRSPPAPCSSRRPAFALHGQNDDDGRPETLRRRDARQRRSVALITYMRTDSTRISDDALKACRDHIKATYGDKYLPEKPNVYAASKDAQGAHEAIRPTDLSYTPEKVASVSAVRSSCGFTRSSISASSPAR